MAQEKPSTPEKQLLNLIEDSQEQDGSQKKIKRSSFNLVSLAALRGRYSFLLESIRSGSFFKKTFFDIKGINKILQICIALLILYIIVHFTLSTIKLKEIPEFAANISRSSGEIRSVELTSQRISDYLEGPRSRNIFRFGDSPIVEKEEVEEVARPVEIIVSKAELLAQNLELVGIGWSDNPDVMIKNNEMNKTYFLKRGERIEGLIKVEAVFQDKVILTYGDGQEIELR